MRVPVVQKLQSCLIYKDMKSVIPSFVLTTIYTAAHKLLAAILIFLV